MAGNNKHNRRKSRASIASTATTTTTTPNVTPTKVTKQRHSLQGDKYNDWVDQIKKLERERDALRKQVLNLANFNYAREPEFVRDRLKLREVTEEVAKMVRQTTGRNLEPILENLSTIQQQLAQEARHCEELSESMAQDFLTSSINVATSAATRPITVASAPSASNADSCTHDHDHEHNHDDDGDDEDDEITVQHGDDVKHEHQHGRDQSAYDEFLHQYINLRKKASKKRILADRLAKERDSLANNILFKSLILANPSNHSNGNNPTDDATNLTTSTSCTRASSRCSHKSTRSSCSSSSRSRRDGVNCVIDNNNNVDTSSRATPPLTATS